MQGDKDEVYQSLTPTQKPYRPVKGAYDEEAGTYRATPLPGSTNVFDMEKQIRLGFIRKVYGILSLQLALTVGVAALSMYCIPMRDYLINHLWVFYTSLFAGLFVLITLHCFRDKHPTNIIMLGVFTLFEALTIGTICAMYSANGAGDIILEAAGLTMAVFIGLTLFTFQTKIDFSFLGAGLFCCLWILIIWGIITAIMGFYNSFLYSLFGAIIFSLMILFDTSMIMKRLSPDEYILGAISLYLDILNLFLYILQLLSSRN